MIHVDYVPDRPAYDHPDVAGETQAWCSKCERDEEDCCCKWESEYDYEDRAEATSEYLDNLPKPPEPLPWLPPKKATDRHPFS